MAVDEPAWALGGLFGGMGGATANGVLTQVQTREAALGRDEREDEF